MTSFDPNDGPFGDFFERWADGRDVYSDEEQAYWDAVMELKEEQDEEGR